MPALVCRLTFTLLLAGLFAGGFCANSFRPVAAATEPTPPRPPADDASSATNAVASPPAHWSLRPVVRPAVPTLPDARLPVDRASEPPIGSRADHPLDAFVRKELVAVGVRSAPPAAPATLVRRLYLDLIGLPPPPEEVAAFQADPSDEAYRVLVDRLLQSPHHAERWARHWLDAARYSDSQGCDRDQPRHHAWRYRQWVIEAIQRDLPFDQFTIEQLAGDLLDQPTLDQLVATGFHRHTPHNAEAGAGPDEDWRERCCDRVETTAAVWLGATLSCARCHDHPHDPFSQREYLALFAFFANSQEDEISAPLPDELAAYLPRKAAHDRQLEGLANTQRRYEELVATPACRQWEAALPPPRTAVWTTLDIDHAEADHGETMTRQPDGSWLVSGPIPDSSSYDLEGVTSLSTVTAIRLELFPDPSLPHNGPGRAPDGDFQLNSFTVTVEPRHGGDRETTTSPGATSGQQTLKLMHPLASHELPEHPIAAAVGPFDARRGWSIGDCTGQTPAAVFELDEPLTSADQLRIRVRLRQGEGELMQLIGRLRVSVTDEPVPFLCDQVAGEAAELLTKPARARTDAEQRQLLLYYCSRDPHWLTLADALANRRRLAPRDPHDTRAYILRERSDRAAAHVLEHGDFQHRGEAVSPGVPACLPPLTPRGPVADRLDLARWLVDPRHPRTARVTVNRVWQHYFGRGLVDCDSNFGRQGSAPSHPELLDWLASEFVARGWSGKELHRLIVTSATYRQASTFRPELAAIDPHNRLLARQQRLRLEAEIIRDVALAAAGLLNPAIGGPSIVLPQPSGADGFAFSRAERLEPTWDAGLFRRGLYVWHQRTAPYPSLAVFDAPSAHQTCTRRPTSTTPMQALTLLNDPLFFECARALAQRLMSEAETLDQRIDRLFAWCMARRPSQHERDELQRLYQQHCDYYAAHPDLARDLIGRAPAERVDDQTARALAAWTAACRTVMNLEEFCTRE